VFLFSRAGDTRNVYAASSFVDSAIFDSGIFVRYVQRINKKAARFTAKSVFICAQTTAIQTLNYTK